MANLREKQKQQTRTSLLEHALRLFQEKGYVATTIDDIATAVGTTRVTFYAHFPNKEALFLAALDEDAAAVISEGVLHLLDDSVASAEWHETLILTLVAAVDRHPLARRVIAGLEPDVTDRVIDEDQPLTINFTVGDAETAAAQLRVTASSGNTALVRNSDLQLDGSSANRTLTLTPTHTRNNSQLRCHSSRRHRRRRLRSYTITASAALP